MKWSSAGKEIRDMTEVASELENMPELVIVSGMSGAGRTEAMHAFEDLGASPWSAMRAAAASSKA